MKDSSFTSTHLHALPRRQDYRRARDILLRSRSEQTLEAEKGVTRKTPLATPTMIEKLSGVPRYALRLGEMAYPLQIGLNAIGRSPDNDIVLSESYISRRHCAIVVHASSGCELHDLASKNGTFLNSQRLGKPTWLVAGDIIRLCDRQFAFTTEDAPAGDGTLADF